MQENNIQQSITARLQRSILSGKEFEPLIPPSTGKSVALQSGDTFTSIKHMVGTIKAYHKQCELIAPLLIKDDLQSTCTSVYNWLYNHIQYKADGLEQLIRSPSNSFSNRQTGIDCKSFSVFASCILSCLGIEHYIRQIKQPTHAPDLFTHVYVVVPNNQETCDLQNGYFVIDATTRRNIEPIYTMAHDTKVNLPHVGLNAPAKAKKEPKPAKNNNNRNILLSAGALIAGLFFMEK